MVDEGEETPPNNNQNEENMNAQREPASGQASAKSASILR